MRRKEPYWRTFSRFGSPSVSVPWIFLAQYKLVYQRNLLTVITGHTTGSAWISGEDTLGMKPETEDETYPMLGKVSLPRMIIAQFDGINCTYLLAKYRKKVLQSLEKLMRQGGGKHWFAVYITLFILLREASWISADRFRHARANCGNKVSLTTDLSARSKTNLARCDILFPTSSRSCRMAATTS